MSIAQQILDFKKSNPTATPADIATALGVKRTTVYSTLSYHKKNGTKVAKRRGRPRKFVTPVVEMQTIKHDTPLEGVMLDKIRAATIGVQDMQIERMADKITQLKAVIRYLEGKVYGASV